MPIPTQPLPPSSPPPAANRTKLATIAAAGAAYALAELLAGLLIGRFFAWGRAEALLFLALRPWLLLAFALLSARFATSVRIGFYLAGLGLAALSQTLLLLAMGASNPLPEALRGLAAGALLILVIDLLVQLGIRFLGRWGRAAAGAGAAALLIVPGALLPYERIVIGGGGSRQAADKPELMLMTSLPLMWGEGGPLDPASRPAEAYKLLEREFAIRPLDVLDGRSLATGKLLLLAQPRALAPADLVALDSWVRGGGRALILTDPVLAWPSELALGDFRRPPAIGLLGPLLDHWGLALDPPEQPRALIERVGEGGEARRLVTFAPGTLRARSNACRVREDGRIADCRIGKGRAILLSDADMLHDRLWVAPFGAGAERHTRVADNALIVADLLDGLAGLNRERIAGPVQWADPAANRWMALSLALLPILLAAAPGLARRIRRRG